MLNLVVSEVTPGLLIDKCLSRLSLNNHLPVKFPFKPRYDLGITNKNNFPPSRTRDKTKPKTFHSKADTEQSV